LKIVIKDADDEKVKALDPSYHPFESTVYGVAEKRIRGNKDRWLYVVNLNEALENPGNFRTTKIVLWPAYKDDVFTSLYETGHVGAMITRPLNDKDNFEEIDQSNIRSRFKAIGSCVASVYLLK